MSQPRGNTNELDKTSRTDVATAEFATFVVHGARHPVRVMAISSEIDRSNTQELRAKLHDLIHPSTLAPVHHEGSELITDVVVDLRRIRFISAGALAALALQRDTTGHRLRLVLGSRDIAHRVLTSAGLDNEVELYEDLPEAVLAEPASD
ncbi:STAS domain-containing protein [Actinomycetospora sp. C-140]